MEFVDTLSNFVVNNGASTIVILTALLLLVRSVVISIPKMVRKASCKEVGARTPAFFEEHKIGAQANRSCESSSVPFAFSRLSPRNKGSCTRILTPLSRETR